MGIQFLVLIGSLLKYLIPILFGPMSYLGWTTWWLYWSKLIKSTLVICMNVVAYSLLAQLEHVNDKFKTADYGGGKTAGNGA